MPIAVASSQFFGFADGSVGHVCTFTGGAPSVGDWDVLCVNSATTVATPAGWSVLDYSVGGQGAYLLTRKAAGGEGASTTLTTNGDYNCAVSWVRITGAAAVDVTGKSVVNGVAGHTSPALTSSALAAADELALAFCAVHDFVAATPSAPAWSPYTETVSGSHNTSTAGGVYSTVAYRTPVGTAPESPAVSWVGDAHNRYLFFVAFTAAPTGVDPLPVGPRIVTTTPGRLSSSTPPARIVTTTQRGRL